MIFIIFKNVIYFMMSFSVWCRFAGLSGVLFILLPVVYAQTPSKKLWMTDFSVPVYTLTADKEYRFEAVSNARLGLGKIELDGEPGIYSGGGLRVGRRVYGPWMFGLGYENMSKTVKISQITFSVNSPGNITYTQKPKINIRNTVYTLIFYIPSAPFDTEIGYGIGKKEYEFDFTPTSPDTAKKSVSINTVKYSFQGGYTFRAIWILEPYVGLGYHIITGAATGADLTAQTGFISAKAEIEPYEVYLTVSFGFRH